MQRVHPVGNGSDDVTDRAPWPPYHWLDSPDIDPGLLDTFGFQSTNDIGRYIEMDTYEDTKRDEESKGGRVRWSNYTHQEHSELEKKFLGDWPNLDFLEYFWNPTYDEGDLLQYRRAAEVWRRRLSGRTFQAISTDLGIDEGKACALVKGNNLHPHLVQMYLVSQHLEKPKDGWKWILERSPKPTNAHPRAFLAPTEIHSYKDIQEFVNQFPAVQCDHPALRRFGLSVDWVELHKMELFGFLLGFLVGDAGKYFPEYIDNTRHYTGISLNTNMKAIDSNIRILTYVQLCLSVIGIQSHEIVPAPGTTRWTSESSNILTWIFKVCLGLNSGERTSRNPVKMDWLLTCPQEFLTGFIQGIAESDGSVDKNGYYADIGSVPNSVFFERIFATIGTPSRVHPKHDPRQLRVNLGPAVRLPMFNPTINSYRFQWMMTHAQCRGLLPPLPSFF